jgi:hypothetical protein
MLCVPAHWCKPCERWATRATRSDGGAQGGGNPRRSQLVQGIGAFIQAVLGALVQDQLFRFLRPVVYLHPTGVRKPSIGFAMHYQQRARCQLPRQVCAHATTPAT